MIHKQSPTKIIDTVTGAVKQPDVPWDVQNGSFSPVINTDDPGEPTIWYYASDSTLWKYLVNSGTKVRIHTFPGTLEPNGASIDWIDRSGRYMVFNISGQIYVWDRLPAPNGVLYANPIDVAQYPVGEGWFGITPDGNYVVAENKVGPGHSDGYHRSWKIHHMAEAGYQAQSVDAQPVLYWSNCGGHGDFVSTKDGKNYEVTLN